MKIVVIASMAVALLFSQAASANTREEIKNLVEERINVVIQTLKDKRLDKSARNRKIIDTISPFFDFQFMAKVCLGKKHWNPLDQAKRREFTDLFVKRLREFYLEKLDLFSNEEVTVEEAKKVKKRIFVVSHIISNDKKMEIIYKFRQKNNEWKVYDMEVLGVSVVQTYRSQFAGFLRKNSFEDLLERLKTKDGFNAPTGENKTS